MGQEVFYFCQRQFQNAVMTGIEISSLERDALVGQKTAAFQTNTFGGAVIEFADVKLTAIGQGVSSANRQHAAAGLTADDGSAMSLFQSSNKNLGGARRAVARENDKRNVGPCDAIGADRRRRPGFEVQRHVSPTIRELPQARCRGKKIGRDAGHRLSIAAAIVAQIQDDAACMTQLFL